MDQHDQKIIYLRDKYKRLSYSSTPVSDFRSIVREVYKYQLGYMDVYAPSDGYVVLNMFSTALTGCEKILDELEANPESKEMTQIIQQELFGAPAMEKEMHDLYKVATKGLSLPYSQRCRAIVERNENLGSRGLLLDGQAPEHSVCYVPYNKKKFKDASKLYDELPDSDQPVSDFYRILRNVGLHNLDRLTHRYGSSEHVLHELYARSKAGCHRLLYRVKARVATDREFKETGDELARLPQLHYKKHDYYRTLTGKEAEPTGNHVYLIKEAESLLYMPYKPNKLRLFLPWIPFKK